MAADVSKVFANGVKLVGEAFLPGASLLLDGNLGNGVVHAVVGFGARLALGPVGFIVVAADSFSKSVTEKYLREHVTEAVQTKSVPASEATPAGEGAEQEAAPSHRATSSSRMR
jgi:hypothetical protein